jgi:hypothetical protein
MKVKVNIANGRITDVFSMGFLVLVLPVIHHHLHRHLGFK